MRVSNLCFTKDYSRWFETTIRSIRIGIRIAHCERQISEGVNCGHVRVGRWFLSYLTVCLRPLTGLLALAQTPQHLPYNICSTNTELPETLISFIRSAVLTKLIGSWQTANWFESQWSSLRVIAACFDQREWCSNPTID